MNLFKTNRSYWEELKAKGWLYSLLKDGAPRGPGQRLLAFLYPLILVGMAIFTVAMFLRLPRQKWKLRTLIPCLIFSTVLGWSWGAWMIHADPTFPGWLFPSWAVTGKEFVLSLEDLVFYPLCTIFFYLVFRKVSLPGEPWTSDRGHFAVLAVYGIMSVFFLLFTSTAGRSEALMFAIPGMIMYALARDRIDIRKFLVFQVFVVLFAGIWDLAAVSWIHRIPGFAWASDWAYITFDANGGYHHSKIFLDYGTHRWAWIYDNPIEITPWLGIVGGIFNYGLFSFGDKIFARKK